MSRLPHILAFLAILTLLAGPVDAQVVPNVDLAIDGIALVGATPGWDGATSRDGTVKVAVVNQGTAPLAYRIDLEWVGPTGASPLNGDTATSFDVSRQPLAVGARSVHELPWTLQPGQEGAGHVAATVQAAEGADADMQDNRGTLAVFVPVHRLAVTIAGAPLRLEPEATGFFRLRFANEGNIPEAVELRLAGRNGDARILAALTSSRVVIEPAQTRAEHLLLSFRPQGDFSPARANFTIEAVLGSGQTISLRTPEVDGVDGDGDLTGFSFTLEPSGPGPWHVSATTPRDLSMRLHNTGSRADNYTLSLETDAGWAVAAIPSLSCLLPGESALVNVRVQAPAGAAPGSAASLRVGARGSLAPTLHSFDSQLVVGGPSPQVDEIAFTQVPYVGQPVVVSAGLRNQGDQVQPASEAAFRWRMPGVLHEVRSAIPVLAAGASYDLEVDLPAPAQGGDIEVEVRWPADVTSGIAAASFVHEADLVLSAPEPLGGAPGETVPYRLPPNAFRITNQGNADEVVALSVHASAGVPALDQSAVLDLAPGETRTVLAHLVLPDPAGALTSAILGLQASIAGAATPWEAEVATAIVDPEPPRLKVPSLPRLWTLGVPLAVDLDAQDQAPLAWVLANVTSPTGQSDLLPLHRSGGRWSATLTFDVAGNHTVRFMAADQAGNNVTSAAMPVRAALVDPPRLRWDRADRTQVQQGAVLRLDVDDDLPLHPIEITVRQAPHVETFLVPVRNGTAEFALDAPAAGNVSVEARAKNWAGASTVARLDLQMAAVVLTPQTDEEPTKQARDAPGQALGVAGLTLALAAARRRR